MGMHDVRGHWGSVEVEPSDGQDFAAPDLATEAPSQTRGGRPTTEELIAMAASVGARVYQLDPDAPIAGPLEEAVLRYLEAAEDKIEAIYHVRTRLLAEEELLKLEETRLAARRRIAARRREEVDGLAIGLLKAHRQALGLDARIASATVTARLVRNPPAVQIEEGASFERRWLRIVAEPDKEKIRGALELGEEVPGASLVCGEHIRWR